MKYTQEEIYTTVTFCLVPSPHLQAFLPFKNAKTGEKAAALPCLSGFFSTLTMGVSREKSQESSSFLFGKKKHPSLTQKVGVYKLPKRLPALNETQSRVIMTLPF